MLTTEPKNYFKTHQDQHRQVAELLLEREVIFSDDLERILGKRPWKDDEEEETKEEKTVENEIKIAMNDWVVIFRNRPALPGRAG